MKTLYVQVKGNPSPVHLESDKVEENKKDNELLAYRGSEIIGRFNLSEIAGWWLDDYVP
jgi:hypothetical protein